MCRHSRGIIFPFNGKTHWQMFLLFYGRHVSAPRKGTNKVFYVWLIYHIPDFWLNSLNGYDFYFWLRDTANQPYVETSIPLLKQQHNISWLEYKLNKVLRTFYNNSYNLLKLKRKRSRRRSQHLTDLEWPKVPAKRLNSPSDGPTTHLKLSMLTS